MKFEKLRHRIVFLKPVTDTENSMGESVPIWKAVNPAKNNNLNVDDISNVYLSDDYKGNAVFVDVDGTPYASRIIPKEYEVWAGVSPMTGREYEEAQKLRGETTYNVITRYFRGVTADMKILFRNRIFDIISVLNIDERNEQLKIVAKERDKNGCE